MLDHYYKISIGVCLLSYIILIIIIMMMIDDYLLLIFIFCFEYVGTMLLIKHEAASESYDDEMSLKINFFLKIVKNVKYY
jgi:hypothetical protein